VARPTERAFLTRRTENGLRQRETARLLAPQVHPRRGSRRGERLDPEQRRHLFLIFKEAINNIARHAECASVSLTIKVSRNRLIVEIQDDGRGFSDLRPQKSLSQGAGSGHGLENMQSRAEELGGHLSVDSAPGHGTRLKLMVPIRKP